MEVFNAFATLVIIQVDSIVSLVLVPVQPVPQQHIVHNVKLQEIGSLIVQIMFAYVKMAISWMAVFAPNVNCLVKLVKQVIIIA